METLHFLSTEQRSPTKADRDRYAPARIAEEPDSAARIRLRATLDEAPWGSIMPEVDRVIAARDGKFWIRRAPQGEAEMAEWLVIDGANGVVHRLLLDRSLRVQFVDDSRILALQSTPDGYERLREFVYRD